MKIRPRFGCFFLKYTTIKAVVLYPFIFFRESYEYCVNKDPQVLKHEAIHIDQINRMGFLQFYTSYITNHEELEAEAYANQHLPLTQDELKMYELDKWIDG